MRNDLNASGYSYNQVNYSKEFERLLTKIVLCYNMLVRQGVKIANDENTIRNVLLLNYLKDDNVRRQLGLTDYLFDREVPEDNTIGRTDIKVQSQDTFFTQEAYYIFECKRLDNAAKQGTTGLNAKYIENGIFRFISDYYSSYYRMNALLGFVVESMDIHSNINDINLLLKKNFKNANTIMEIRRESFIPDFEFHYSSEHMTVKKNNIKLYHLMLNLSDQII